MPRHFEPNLLPVLCDAVVKSSMAGRHCRKHLDRGTLTIRSIGDVPGPRKAGNRNIHAKSFTPELLRTRLENIASIDVNMLHALFFGVSWPHRPEDWDMLRHVGQGFAATDGIGRVFGTAMWFSHGRFATIGMVITSHRLQAQGNGRWLIDQFSTVAGIVISASTQHVRPITFMISLGFTPEATVYQCQGAVASRLPALRPMNGKVRTISRADFDAVAALDARAFGADRTRLLHILARNASAYGVWRDGALVALCFPPQIWTRKGHRPGRG